MEQPNKCLIIVRASTDRQEIESQLKEVKQFANLNYKDNDIVVEAVKGASAIKLNKEYEDYLKRIYSHLEYDNIKEVVAWSLDRIGRNEEVLMKFKNYCIKHNIQLTILNPQLKLLNVDGSVNNGIELAMSLFATLAKQEMMQKLERFKRAKKHNSELGRTNGARIKLGYTKDENGYIIIDEIWSSRIRHIYELYATKKYSYKTLYLELKTEGYDLYFSEIKQNFTIRTIERILKDTAYIGEKTRYCQTKHPIIIDKKLWNKVAKVKKENTKSQVKSEIKFFASKIFRCSECNSAMVAANNSAYRCWHINTNSELNNVSQCSNESFISVSWLDSMLLYVVSQLTDTYKHKHEKLNKSEISKRIEEIKHKIEICVQQRKVLDKKIERIENLYIENGDKEKYDLKMSEVKNERLSLRHRFIELNDERELLYYNEGLPLEQNQIQSLQKYNENITESQVYDLIHKFIKKVEVINDRENTTDRVLCKLVTITPMRYIDKVDMGEQTFKFRFYPHKHKTKKVEVYNNSKWTLLALKKVVHNGNNTFTLTD